MFRPRLGRLRHHAPRPLDLAPLRFVGRDSNELPRISVVTPSYAQGEFIERTIRSVLDQGYPNLEYRVQDGGSSDATVEILERYAPRLSGWQSCPDNGQAEALNRAFSATTGEVMGWLNSDDMYLPGALYAVGAFFRANPEVDVIYGFRILVDENDQELGRWILPPHDDRVLSWADYVPQETLFWRRRAWVRIGGCLDEEFQFALDWDLLLRLRDAGAEMAVLPEYLGAFRVHARQKTSHSISAVGFAEMDRLRRRVHGRAVTQTEVRRAVAPYLVRHLFHHASRRLRDRVERREWLAAARCS